MTVCNIVKRAGKGGKILANFIVITEMLLLLVPITMAYFALHPPRRETIDDKFVDLVAALHYDVTQLIKITASIVYFMFSVWQVRLLFLGSMMGCGWAIKTWCLNQKNLIFVQLLVGAIVTLHFKVIPLYAVLPLVFYTTATSIFIHVYYFGYLDCNCLAQKLRVEIPKPNRGHSLQKI